jgi:2-polyprenyl-3-methyl-5-hydroxy-6-metoxy-1,4-benzoquinol methylase
MLGDDPSRVPEVRSDLRRLAREQWAAGHAEAALSTAWAAYEEEPDDRDGRALLAHLLFRYPIEIGPEKSRTFLELMEDPQIDPDQISAAGWHLILRGEERWQNVRNDADFAALAAHLDGHDLTLTLLRESPVCNRAAERTLTRLRRWLLLSGRWHCYEKLADALQAQAILNGGAWPFDQTERAALNDPACLPIVAAYLPRSAAPKSDGDAVADAVTQAVTKLYEGWPFPAWRRITVGNPTRLPDEIRKLDPEGPNSIPADANVLIAGCGTGREAATVALTYPEATVTAIDLSESSLDYARRQCGLVGAPNIRFIRLDLHKVAELGERFDAIYCSGVLHHLPDPENGWRALEAVLQPGGVMKIMVYSRIARFLVIAARTLIRDLMVEPITDEVLRRVRQRIMEHTEYGPANLLMNTQDFSTLVGTYDLLLHPHEDPFDVPRIARALDRLGLHLISFLLPTTDAAARYDARYPHDPGHRDMAAWAQFEKNELPIYAGLYAFMCRKPLAA